MELHLTAIIAEASSVAVVKKGVNQDAKTGAKRVQKPPEPHRKYWLK